MSPARTALLAVVVACASSNSAAGCPTVRAQDAGALPTDAWQAVRGEGFTVLYHSGGEEVRDLVVPRVAPARFALEDALGARLPVPLTVRLHPDIGSFLLSNPLATESDGVFGGARRGRREVEIVVPQALADGPEGVDGALRREMARLLLLERSGGAMPDVFVDGLADAFAPKGILPAAGVARLREAWTRQGLPFWSAVAAPDGPYLDPPVVRPMARSIAGFLLQLGGLEQWLAAADRLREGDPWREAFQAAYGAPADALEREWLMWLPSHLDGGWRRSVLYEPDLAAARAMLAAGDHEGVARALRPTLPLVALDDAGAALEIEQLLAASGASADGARVLARALEALAAGDYDGAEREARQAAALLSGRSVAERSLAEEAARRAELGRLAEARLRQAESLSRWRMAETRRLARSAASEFSRLGNDAAAARAANLATEADRRLLPAGQALMVAGTGLLAWNVRLRRRVGRRAA